MVKTRRTLSRLQFDALIHCQKVYLTPDKRALAKGENQGCVNDKVKAIGTFPWTLIRSASISIDKSSTNNDKIFALNFGES
jgi:hypothetical protein